MGPVGDFLEYMIIAFISTLRLATVGGIFVVPKETLRLWPPVPQDSKIAFSDDVLPDGTKVPKNTMLLFMPTLGKKHRGHGRCGTVLFNVVDML